MSDHIVVDIEIKTPIVEKADWERPDLGVSCAVVYVYEEDRYRVYGDTPVALDLLRAVILAAGRVSGFNTFKFDLPVIWGVSRSQWPTEEFASLLPRQNDILRRIWIAKGLDPDNYVHATHGGVGLDAVVKATLGGPGKIGYGGDAPLWYQNGEWGKLVNYCLDDVALEKQLVDFVDRYGYIIDPVTMNNLVI